MLLVCYKVDIGREITRRELEGNWLRIDGGKGRDVCRENEIER